MNKSRIRILAINSVLLLAVIGIGSWGWSALHPAPAKVTTTTTTVSVGDVTSSVSASGTVVSPGDVGVSPSVSAQITKINVKVGDRVSAGSIMANLDNAALLNSLNQSRATLMVAQTAFKKATLDSQTAISAAKKAVNDAVSAAATNKITYQAAVDAAQNTLNSDQINRDNYFNTWSPYGFTLTYCKNLNLFGLNTATVTDAFSHCATITGNENTLVTDKAKLDSAILSQKNGLVNDQQAITDASTNLQTAITVQSFAIETLKAQQGITVENPTAVDFSVAQSALALAQKNYESTFVRAPVSGTVASISAGVGQNAPTASSSTLGAVTGFIVLTDVSSLEVSASFSEADSAKLIVGQDASFTFSALSNISAVGKVLSIDPLPTTTSGATTYKALFTVSDKIPTLKPGMTTTVTVTTGAAFNVLQVAAQAITTRGATSILNVITTKAGKEVTTPTPVVVGLKGDSSDQIISGVKPGDKVVLRTATASTGSNGFPSTAGGLGGAVAVPGGGGGRGFGG